MFLSEAEMGQRLSSGWNDPKAEAGEEHFPHQPQPSSPRASQEQEAKGC